jgi:hypothetical protein
MGGLGFNGTIWHNGVIGSPKEENYLVHRCKICRRRLREGDDIYRVVLQYLTLEHVCEPCKDKIWHG